MELKEKTIFESEDKTMYVEKTDDVFNINIDDEFSASDVQKIINVLTKLIK